MESPKVEPIAAFEFACTPWASGPIRSCTMIIYAKSEAEAREVFMTHGPEFLEQNMNVMCRQIAEGYRQVQET